MTAKLTLVFFALAVTACGRSADDIEHAPVRPNIDPVVVVDEVPVPAEAPPEVDPIPEGTPITIEEPPLAEIEDMTPPVVTSTPTPVPVVTPYPPTCKVWTVTVKHHGRKHVVTFKRCNHV